MVGYSAGCGDEGGTSPEPASLSDLLGNQLYRADGSQLSIQALDDVSVIALYFASPTCPSCGAFTPILVDAYDELQGDGRSFEVVLVNLGGGGVSLFEYMEVSGMSWLAIPSPSNRANDLVRRYNVRFIPTLVIIDGDANTISLNGRDELVQNGTAVYDVWLAASGGS